MSVAAKQFLSEHRESIPAWLERYEPGTKINPADFFSARVVFYPGSGQDGQPVALFGGSHSAHCFVYADYGVSQQDLIVKLNEAASSFRGYRVLSTIELTEQELAPQGWGPHISAEEWASLKPFAYNQQNRFGFYVVLERNHAFDNSHGPQRLVVLFLGADGFATFDALFCQHNAAPPYAIVIQDHGFGLNYNAFGRGGLLELIAYRASVKPEWLLVAENSQAWQGYREVPDVQGERGGEHDIIRKLYCRD